MRTNIPNFGRELHSPMKRLALGSLMTLGIAVALELPAAAADWPQWRGAGREGRVSGFAVPAVWPEKLQLRWRQPVGLGDATPALVGDRLFVFGRVGAEEVIACLAAADGKEIWRQAYAAEPVTGPAEKYAGPRSSLAVANGRVVALGVGKVLSCLDAATGQVAWRHEALAKGVPRFFNAMSPLIVDGTVVVHVGAKDEGLLLALDLATGQTKWQWAGDGPAYSSPIVAVIAGVRQLLLQTEKSLRGLRWDDGRPRWEIVTSPKPGYWNSVTPVVAGDVVYYTGQGTGLRAARIERGADDRWEARPLWHNEDLGTVYNTPVLKDGFCYGLSPRGQFFCLEAATGATKWLHAPRLSNFGSLVDGGPVLVALLEKTGLHVLKPSPAGHHEIARYAVSETPVYSHPVLAGRGIFVRDRDTVALWELPEG
jgi:outer membrane protein assembly factor BamB